MIQFTSNSVPVRPGSTRLRLARILEVTAWSNPISDCGSNFMYEGKDHPRSSWQLPRVRKTNHVSSPSEHQQRRQWTIQHAAARIYHRVQNIQLVYSGYLHCLTVTIWLPALPTACAPCTLSCHCDLEQLDAGCSHISALLKPSQSSCPVVARHQFLLFFGRNHHYLELPYGSCPSTLPLWPLVDNRMP